MLLEIKKRLMVTEKADNLRTDLLIAKYFQTAVLRWHGGFTASKWQRILKMLFPFFLARTGRFKRSYDEFHLR